MKVKNDLSYALNKNTLNKNKSQNKWSVYMKIESLKDTGVSLWNIWGVLENKLNCIYNSTTILHRDLIVSDNISIDPL